MAKKITLSQVLEMLKKDQGTMSVRGYSKSIGMAFQTISDVLLRKRLPPKSMLRHFGLRKRKAPPQEPTYERVKL